MNERTGDYCPQCGSTEIEGEGVEIGRDTATQEVGCNTCCAEWYGKRILQHQGGQV